jgi:hypothetical protein
MRHTLRRRRIVGGLVVVGALAGTLALAGAAPSPAPVAFLAGLLFAPVMASPVEWAVHRYLYHRPAGPLRRLFDVHHRSHHQVFFPTSRYVTSGPVRRIALSGGRLDAAHDGGLANAATRLAHCAFYFTLAGLTVCLPAWALTGRMAFLAGAVAGSLLVSDLMVRVHDTIHRPGSHPLVEAQPWFRWLDRHHYVHHVDTEANVNFLLPLADALFGTLRLGLTAGETARHGTWETARARLQGQGEPVRAPRPSTAAVA